MPDYNVVFREDAADLAGAERTDGYVEVVSLEGHGIQVVTPARRDELVAALVWEDLEPVEPP